jgi:diaminopropionate ammonia-lyase
MAHELLIPFENGVTGHVENAFRSTGSVPDVGYKPLFSQSILNNSREAISAWPGYQPTPLQSLRGLARELDVASIQYKDEGSRFGLGSFKALGGAYAVQCLVEASSADPHSITVASATDGNHGLSVAWGAKNRGCQCVIYIHAEVSAGREQALRSKGADVIRIEGNYDDSVRRCYIDAAENGWKVVSDTSNNESGDAVARQVMAGYSVMVAEIVDQLNGTVPTHVFVQGGVGGLAATVCEYFRMTWETTAPRFIIVEPNLAPCLFESAKRGERVSVDVREETIMAGLSCGEVSNIAWPTLSRFADDFLTIPDTIVAPAMRLLADAPFDDVAVVAGESAVAGLAGFLSAKNQPALGSSLGLDQDSRILVIGTEGATDPALYESLTGRAVASVQRANI